MDASSNHHVSTSNYTKSELMPEEKAAEKSGKYISKEIVSTRPFKNIYDSCSYGKFRNESNKKRLRSKDIVINAIISRYNETRDKLISVAGIVSDDAEKGAEFILSNLKGDRPLSDYEYCREKFDKVRRSKRNIRFINRSGHDSGWCSRLKSKFIGNDQFYHSAFLYSSIRGESENLNCKIKIGEKIIGCGVLATMYMKGYIGPGKKDFKICNSEEVLRERAQSALQDDSLIDTKSKEKYLFNWLNFPVALEAIVKKDWSLSNGEKKAYQLEMPYHAAAFILEKKKNNVMIVRFYDANWTFSYMKVILNKPEYARDVHLSCLYRQVYLNSFCKSQVGRINSLDQVQHDDQAFVRWVDRDNVITYQGREFCDHCSDVSDDAKKFIKNSIDAILKSSGMIRSCEKDKIVYQYKPEGTRERELEWFLNSIEYPKNHRVSTFIDSIVAQSDYPLYIKLKYFGKASNDCLDRGVFRQGCLQAFRESMNRGGCQESIECGLNLAFELSDWELVRKCFKLVWNDANKSVEEKLRIIQWEDRIEEKSATLLYEDYVKTRYFAENEDDNEVTAHFILRYWDEMKDFIRSQGIENDRDYERIKECVLNLVNDKNKTRKEKEAILLGEGLEKKTPRFYFMIAKPGKKANCFYLSEIMSEILSSNLGDNFKEELFVDEYIMGFMVSLAEVQGNPEALRECIQTVLNANSKSVEEKTALIKRSNVVYLAMLTGNSEIINVVFSEVLTSELPEENKVDLLKACELSGRSGWCWLKSLEYDLYSDCVSVITNSNLTNDHKAEIIRQS